MSTVDLTTFVQHVMRHMMRYVGSTHTMKSILLQTEDFEFYFEVSGFQPDNDTVNANFETSALYQ